MSELEIRILRLIRKNLKEALEYNYSVDYRSATVLTLELLALLLGEEEEETKGEDNNG